MISDSSIRYSVVSPQRAFPKCTLERRRDAILREFALLAQKADDSREVRLARGNLVLRGNRRFQINSTDLVNLADGALNVIGHPFDPAKFDDQLQRLLRPNPFHALIEIGADEDREIDELLSADMPVLEKPIQLDQLRHDRTKRPLAREKLLPGDREKPDEPRRAEEKCVIVLAGRDEARPVSHDLREGVS